MTELTTSFTGSVPIMASVAQALSMAWAMALGSWPWLAFKNDRARLISSRLIDMLASIGPLRPADLRPSLFSLI